MERLGVVGAGTMGAGIAQLGCLGGFRVTLHDADGVHPLQLDQRRKPADAPFHPLGVFRFTASRRATCVPPSMR